MERPTEGPSRPEPAQRMLAALILLPGLLVAGLAIRDVLVLLALQGRIIEQRAILDNDLVRQWRMLQSRKDLLNGAVNLVAPLGCVHDPTTGWDRVPDPTPGWERVLAAVPPEATAGRVVFCTDRSEVTIHGGRADEALLARVAGELATNPEMQRVELSGQGSDDVALTVVPQPIPPNEEVSP